MGEFIMPKTVKQRAKEYRARMKAKGYVPLNPYVPAELKPELLRMIAERVSEYEEEK